MGTLPTKCPAGTVQAGLRKSGLFAFDDGLNIYWWAQVQQNAEHDDDDYEHDQDGTHGVADNLGECFVEETMWLVISTSKTPAAFQKALTVSP